MDSVETRDNDWIIDHVTEIHGVRVNTEPSRLALLSHSTSEWQRATREALKFSPVMGDETAKLDLIATATNMATVRQILNECLLEVAQQGGGSESTRAALQVLFMITVPKRMVLFPFRPATNIKWLNNHLSMPPSMRAELGLPAHDACPKYFNAAAAILYCATDLHGPEDFTDEFLREVYQKVIFFLKPNYMAALGNLLRKIAGASKVESAMREARRLRPSPRFARQRPDQPWIIDPETGDPRFSEWQTAIADWLQNLTHKSSRKSESAAKRFVAYIRQCDDPPLSPQLLRRCHVVKTSETREVPFIDWLMIEKSINAARESCGRLRDLMAHWHDTHPILGSDEVWNNPFQTSDLEGLRGSSTHNKSVKYVLPQQIIEIAKQVLLEDDYAWPRRQKMCRARALGRPDLFSPVLPVAIFTLLVLPLRSIQLRLLDSGEADELQLDERLERAVNTSTHAIRGRQEGFLKRFEPFGGPGSEFVGFHITTNKTDAAQKGEVEIPFDIPWQAAELIPHIRRLQQWQAEVKPLDRLRTRKELHERETRIDGKIANLPKYAFLFRDPGGQYPKEPVTYNKLANFWACVLEEVENRLRRAGTPVRLIEGRTRQGKSAQPVAIYTLHAMRVSGITYFIESGVPIHIVSEFLAGHANIIITLYYTKIAPAKVNEIIERAADQSRELSERGYFAALSELSKAELKGQLVVSDGAAAHVSGGDPGVWHLDVDGFCVCGRTQCAEGGAKLKNAQGKEYFEGITFDRFNCGACRFHATGPAFLAGQVLVFNSLLHEIHLLAKKRDDLQNRFDLRQDDCVRAKSDMIHRLERIDQEMDSKVRVLASRFTRLQQSLELHERKRAGGKQALITGLDRREVSVAIESARDSDLLDFAAHVAEFFPELTDDSARMRKGLLLERMASRDGLGSLFLHLPDAIALSAANRFTELVKDLIGSNALTNLMEGAATFRELGLIDQVPRLKDRAIELAREAHRKLADSEGLAQIEARRDSTQVRG
uniref:Phage integrase family protein n=1 Tax=Cereibacter sphaeroides (strain ATCC 17025 / ATH 2.4.3) TaxID=349102 RepID=A4WQG7_CERS5